MERNKKFIIEALLDVQNNCKDGSPYNICSAMCEKGYNLDECRYHLDLMDDAGYLMGTYKMMGKIVLVKGLTNLGYDYLEKETTNKEDSRLISTNNYYIDKSVNIDSKSKIKNVVINTGDNSKPKIVSEKNTNINVIKEENKKSIFAKIMGFFKNIFS